MPRKILPYQQHRQTGGNHNHWQSKKLGSQRDQDDRVQRLARQPGLHTGNTRRYTVTRSMVQLLSILSVAQISRASPAATPADGSTDQGTTYGPANNTRIAEWSPPHRHRHHHSAGKGMNPSARHLTDSTPLVSLNSNSSAYARHSLNPRSPVSSADRSAKNFPSRYDSVLPLQQKMSIASKNIPNAILDTMSDSRFDYRLRNTLDNIFRLAERAPPVRQAPVEDRNLLLLMECIQQMAIFIEDNSLPRTSEAQEMLDALFNIADRLDTPHEKGLVKTFKQHFDSAHVRSKAIDSLSSPRPDLSSVNPGGAMALPSSDASRITLAGQNRAVNALLTEALDYYSLPKERFFSDPQKMSIVAAYLNQQIFGMTLNEWCMNLRILKSDEYLTFTNEQLGDYIYSMISQPINKWMPSREALSFYKNHILNRSLPTITLPLNARENKELESMCVTQPEWGFVHAGAMLLNDSGVELKDSSLADITDIGITLHTMLSQRTVPAEYRGYFKLPALLYYTATKPNLPDWLGLQELDIEQVYLHYFDYIKNWGKKHNPFTKLPDLMQKWKTRTGLAREILSKEFNISAVSHRLATSYLNGHTSKQYLYTKALVAPNFPDVPGYPEVQKLLFDDPNPLPDINIAFEEQNRQLANVVAEIEELLLPRVFRSLNENEQRFIEQSKVERLSFVLSAKYSRLCCYAPSLEGTVVGFKVMPRYSIPNHIDMLGCTSNNEERIYALSHSSSTGAYTLRRVDRKKEAFLSLLDKSSLSSRNPNHIPSRNSEYQLNVVGRNTLKEPSETSQKFIENLVEYRKKRLIKALYDQGYDKTEQEKVMDFILSLVPFYSCITERIKGNTRDSNIACAIDALFMVPFAGQLVSTGMHFGTALGRSAVMAIKYGARQSTFKGMLKQTGKELITQFPSVAQHISPQVVIGLGNGFLSSIDPGFELLALGGAKGISAIRNVISKIPDKSAGLIRLAAALGAKGADLAAASKPKNLQIESLYSPEHGKNLDVAIVGEKDGQTIWAEVNRQTGEFFGQKFFRNAEGSLTGLSVKLRHKGQLVQNVRQPGTSSQMKDQAISAPSKDVIKKIGPGWFTAKNVAKRRIDGSSYIHYYTQILNEEKNSEILIVSAHGGYTMGDINAPAVILPSDITIKLLTPHGTMLHDPGLNNVVNAGKDLKAYLTITDGEVTDVDFMSQEGSPHWFMPDDYDPNYIFHTLGREDGLQNYRHIKFERENDKLISKVLLKNRELAKNGKAILTDVLTVNKNIRYVKDSSLEKASVQCVLDLDKAGKLTNEKGERYKTIAFCHCRNGFFYPANTVSTYFMMPAYIEYLGEMASSKDSRTSELVLTVLYRKDVSKEFQIKYYGVGRFIFVPLNKTDEQRS